MKQRPWTKHEQDIADWFHGERTVGSGAIRERCDVDVPRDGTTWRFLFEAKSTVKGSYSVNRDKLWLDTRERTYERSSEMRPAIPIRFLDEKEQVLADTVLIDVHDLAELRERLDELSEALLRVTEERDRLLGERDGRSNGKEPDRVP